MNKKLIEVHIKGEHIDCIESYQELDGRWVWKPVFKKHDICLKRNTHGTWNICQKKKKWYQFWK